MEEFENWSCKVRYALCGWCEKFGHGKLMVKMILDKTCLDTGKKSIDAYWFDSEKAYRRETSKHKTTHGICPDCMRLEVEALNPRARSRPR